MKRTTNNTLKSIIGGIVLLLWGSISCVHTDEFALPELNVNPEKTTTQGNLVSIQALLQMISQQQSKEGRNATVEFEDDIGTLTGYVISDDKAGNFYKELILQDDPTQPTAGIRILMDQNPIFTQYNFGRKVFVPLKGLAAGIKNGVPTLGVLDDHTVGAIGRTQISKMIIRSTETATIIPLEISMDKITTTHLNTLVTFKNVQFIDAEVVGPNPFTFAAQPNDWFDGERTLISCHSSDTLILSTSTFASFKGVTLPNHSGSIQGVITKDFRGKEFNLTINDPTAVNFDTSNRCSP